MTLIGWLIILEIVVGIGLLIWYIHRAHKHVKHSPAEKALKQHLAELEATANKKTSTKAVSKTKKEIKS